MEFSKAIESRGTLTEIDFSRLPFQPARMFIVGDAPAGTVRGGHRHRVCDQILIAVSGAIEVEVRGCDSAGTTICRPHGHAVRVPAGCWAKQTYLEPGSRLLVLCSHPYDPHDYVDDRGS